MTSTTQEQGGSSALVGGPGMTLSPDQIVRFVAEQLRRCDLDGRSLCVLVPDATRSCPVPLLLGAVHAAVHGRVANLTVVVALGTHAAMTSDELAKHLGYADEGLETTYPGITVRNHEWWDDETFAWLGRIEGARVAELSGGLLERGADVRVNRAVVEHDVTLVVGPVFPHEVVGFSGGNKYFFPGVGAQDLTDLTHWLGALITSYEIIGTTGITPVRALIDEAASLIPTQTLALCVVVESGTNQLHAAAFGEPRAAWSAAAGVSAETHVQYLDAPVRRVLSVIPSKYPDIWTAAKGFYKVEPVVADGGEVILYAPHVRQIAAMHPEIDEIGYHCRDFFVKQWDRYEHLHWGVLAHSTHLRGAGQYDQQDGERLRVTVTLATGIPEAVVRQANLGYLDPADVDIAAFEADPDTLVLPRAGEVLFRLR